MDLSTNLWSYKIVLNGERKRLYDLQPRIGVSWHANSSYLVSKPMSWYKADFEAPYGTNPVVVDLQGLGKGHAWVNGYSIGRYWPSWITASNGCSDTCDYRGKYITEKCNTNCGNPSQRWYHVPRSFINKDKNTLVLFEELDGNPQNVSFQTVTTGTVCAHVYEGALLELSCQGGQVISQIEFASFGNPKGKCGSFEQGSWEAIDSRSVVEAACIGRSSCGFVVTKEAFSVAGSNNGLARLAVQGIIKIELSYMLAMGSSSWVGIILLSLAALHSCFAMEVTYDANALIINGERRLIFSGCIHYPRSTVEMWPDIIQKAKDGSLDAIESYVFWILSNFSS
ncbi:hypothetical protein Fmac_026925 [Flemingia macrophylla]|uniref:beta-galactosidase n=1 Tax=Flemingia macrophylla TaxID=520843 RepID=A0ABD1LGC7_9FABA